ncbi:MAG: hypothetical protein HWE30_03615 [Methylocystaceae bacterium]|nr:hypothetical protein [Methylocystaceae bacterium]
MFAFKRGLFAIGLAGLLAVYPHISEAGGFTSADLLKWKISSQNSYFHTSVSMAGVIASQNRREAAQCIDEWYAANEASRDKRNSFIRVTLQKNPTYNPQAVIFAIIRKQCGRLFE